MYGAPSNGVPDPFIICTQARACMGDLPLGQGQSTISSVAWPTANLALFYPFRITRRHNYVRALVANGTVVSGNIDIGVYNTAGTRLFSTGSTAHAGTSQMQSITIDWTLDPGFYLLALACSNVTATFIRNGPQSGLQHGSGSRRMTSAFPLPATATLAAMSNSYLPIVAISEKAWV